jgi:ADP-ribose pyrophosphatase YjhB (NUDIX family)
VRHTKTGIPDRDARFQSGGIAMIEATSCGGVVIFRGKILVLYKNYKNKYEGWVLPKGTVEAGEEYKETALREVKEETGVSASIIKYIGKSQYSFNTPQDMVEKDVHWYLMMADSYYSKPQREEYFIDSGYYKFHEAYHLLKFSNEKQILEKAYNEYLDLKKSNLWGNKKYF